MAKPTLLVVGEMCLPQNEVTRDWDVINGSVTVDDMVDGMFVAYNQLPLPQFSAKVYGTNMSRPSWPATVTTRDIPRDVLNVVTPTAEHAIGLMMALHRNLIPASREPLADRSKFLAPWMLSVMRAGVIGYGRIGRMIAYRLRPLVRNIFTYDPELLAVDPLETVLARSDVLFLCCPSSPFGHPMQWEEFERMPKDALIINIAQPDLIEWVAALDALVGNRIRGIAADVFPEWVARDGAELRQAGKLLLTPHIAGSTLDARQITEKAVLDVMRTKL